MGVPPAQGEGGLTEGVGFNRTLDTGADTWGRELKLHTNRDRTSCEESVQLTLEQRTIACTAWEAA